MPGPRPRKGPQASGQGVAAAKQLGLFVEFNPEEMLLGMDETEDDGDLEAELLALTGEAGSTVRKPAPKAQAPLPMAHIEKLAADCMQEVEDEEDEEEGLEEDTDLLTELQEVLGVDEEIGSLDGGEAKSPDLSEEDKRQEDTEPPMKTAFLMASSPVTEVGEPRGLQALLEERIHNYKEAVASAKEAGEAAKARRCERGLKTLESQLATVRKGRKINEDEIPPPVALGKRPPATQETSRNLKADSPALPAMDPDSSSQHETSLPESSAIAASPDSAADPQALLLARQREYKVAALTAKRAGDLDRARELMKIGKRFGAVLEALEKGQPVDLSAMPPAPADLKELSQASKMPTAVPGLSPAVERVQPVMAPAIPATAVAPAEPQTVLDALQQRLNKYREASIQARASGDERKARMHERIAKQYQDAIRAHRVGRRVDFAELPVPPGFPPIPGLESNVGTSEDSVAATLAAAQRLASEDAAPADEDEDEDKGETPAQAPVAKKPAQPLGPPARSLPESKASSSKESLNPSVQEQLALLEARKLQYQRAALQAKRRQDLEQAKAHMRVAKCLEAQIAQARVGRPVDFSKVPSPLTDEEGDFILIHHEDLRLSQKAEEVYAQLQKMLLEQHEKCLLFSKQFMHQGNVAETTRFEKLAEDRKRQLDILQLAQAQGLDPPSHHFELKTFQTVRIFSELNSTEMHLIIVRGMNLPAPPGVTPDDLDAFVRFEFHYPNSDQAQKSKTAVVKNTNSPEFDQVFKLNINRNHRGFRRVIQSKGIKFEIFHKGSFFRSDKLVGTAHLKLERLENECEIREILEVLDGRKPTGGKLEVKVRLREPLSGQDVQMVTENWLVLEPRGL
ncbi:PREDICTED: coiled-coil and C2 domain-containing protein 1B [Dipodomys ordii]|uniref:Coiled-coil and C2 domain-containing protein 1B n=1 Tax=Dipodomys ordii TaxID=10020 RepID=A0A1S3FMF5_DIPOR|nr:PREDICTED: coiled-coil and C2 domain-containing protein 1B [Dipodomys ordii]